MSRNSLIALLLMHMLPMQAGAQVLSAPELHAWLWREHLPLALTFFALLLTIVGMLYLRHQMQLRSAQLQSVFNHMQEVLFRSDAEGRIVIVTPSVERLTGYRPDELIGRQVSDFYQQSGEREAMFRRLKMEGRVTDARARLRRKDGGKIWVSVNSEMFPDGDAFFVEGTIRDISALVKAEKRMRTLSLAMENSPAGIIITDAKSAIVHINPAYERITGYTRDEVLGKNPSFIASGHTPETTYREMWMTLNRGEVWRGDLYNRRKNGEEFCQWSTIGPVLDEHGEVQFYVAVQEDVSKQRRAASEVHKARSEAERANMEKSRFLSAASHDLRQPMQAMQLYLEILERQADDASSVHELVGKLRQTHANAAELLDRLLHVSRLDSGRIKPEIGVFSVNDLLAEVCEQFLPAANVHGLELRLRLPHDAVLVSSDAILLREMTGNLVSNALKFTNEGGVLLALRRRDTQACIEVWDTGSGIAPENQERIFDELIQLDNPERDRSKGVGLGLSIVRRLARLLNADIRLQSRPGRGTVFSIELPIADADMCPVTAQKAGADMPYPDFCGAEIVLIEDDPIVRKGMELLLAKWGCSVHAFANGEDAVAGTDGAVVAAIICDFRLPGELDGIQSIAAMRRRLGAEVPALLVSGDTDSQVAEQAMQAGIPLLTKPVGSERIALFLRTHVQKG